MDKGGFLIKHSKLGPMHNIMRLYYGNDACQGKNRRGRWLRREKCWIFIPLTVWTSLSLKMRAGRDSIVNPFPWGISFRFSWSLMVINSNSSSISTSIMNNTTWMLTVQVPIFSLVLMIKSLFQFHVLISIKKSKWTVQVMEASH